MAPRAIGCIRLFFRQFFFSTGIPTSSYFLAASNRGWEARRPDLARKIRLNGGCEARRLDLAGMIIPPAAPGTRADEGGGPSQGFLYGCFFYLKWRWALNQEITDSAAQQG